MKPIIRFLIAMLCLTGVYAHINDIISIPGLRIPNEYHTRVLIIDSFTDFLFANLYIGYSRLYNVDFFMPSFTWELGAPLSTPTQPLKLSFGFSQPKDKCS